MAVVWNHGEISVREACARLDRSVAYTTVMTTMDRLFKKRLLARRKVGPRRSSTRCRDARANRKAQSATELVQSLLQRHGSGAAADSLSSLVDAVSDRDRALLDELERLIREKRRAAQNDRGRDDRVFFLHGGDTGACLVRSRSTWR